MRPGPGRGSGSARLAQAIATNCSAIHSRTASRASTGQASAIQGEADQCHATQATVSKRPPRTTQRCQRSFAMLHALS